MPDSPRRPEPELASTDQLALRPTERRFGEGLPSSGPNEQSSTPMWVARPSEPGATPGTDAAPPGAAEVADRARGAPEILGRPDDDVAADSD